VLVAGGTYAKLVARAIAPTGSVTNQDVQVGKRDLQDGGGRDPKVVPTADTMNSEARCRVLRYVHPELPNTHPETYRSFRPQLGRVAMLRDMIKTGA